MRTHTRFFRRGRTAVREPHADIVVSCLPELVAPTVRLHSVRLEAHDEWGPGRHEDGFGLGPSDEVGSRDGFAAWVTMPAGQSGPEAVAAGHDARGDRGERDARRPEFVGDLQAVAVTGGEDLGLSLVAAFPHRTDRVDHVPDPPSEAEGGRRHRISRWAGTDGGTRLCQSRTRRPVDGAVHATAAHQRLVGRGHDGVGLLSGDVTLYDVDQRHALIMPDRLIVRVSEG